MGKLWLRLRNPTWTIQDLDPLAMYRYEDLRFSSSLPGGFRECTFRLPLNRVQAYDWYHRRLNYNVTVMDAQREIWDGRIDSPRLTDKGLEIVARGYSRNAYDVPYNGDQTAAHGDAIIQAVAAASCAQLSTDYSNLDDPGVAAGANYVDNTYPGDIFDRLAEIGNYATPWDWAVWEGRKIHFHARNTVVNWQCHLRDLAGGGYSLQRSLEAVWNSYYADYQAAGARNTTAEAVDAASQAFYGLTRRKYLAAGTVAAGIAQGLRDVALAENKDDPQRSTLEITGYLYGADTGKFQARRQKGEARAGAVIRVLDLVPPGAISSMAARDMLRVFHVQDATYEADSDTLRLTPDYPMQTVERATALLSVGAAGRIQDIAPYFSKL